MNPLAPQGRSTRSIRAPRALFALHALYSRSTRSIRAPRALFAPDPSSDLVPSHSLAPNSPLFEGDEEPSCPAGPLSAY